MQVFSNFRLFKYYRIITFVIIVNLNLEKKEGLFDILEEKLRL